MGSRSQSISAFRHSRRVVPGRRPAGDRRLDRRHEPRRDPPPAGGNCDRAGAGRGGFVARTLRARCWSSTVDAIEKRGISLLDTNNAGLVAKLAAAGYTSPQAPRVFTLIRVGTTLCLPLLLVAATLINGAPPSLFKLYMFGSLLAVLGLYLPNLWVSARASRRQDQITRGFPDALDLMLVCVEAGLGMEAAFDRVGREMATTHPLVAGLLANTVLELRAGRGREDALRRMGERAGVDQIKSFATLLIQSNKLGSSIGQTLRIYATEMRERRKMLAQKRRIGCRSCSPFRWSPACCR